MREKLQVGQVLDLYLTKVIGEAKESLEDLHGSFLIQKAFRGGYIKVHILFVCDTDQMDIEAEMETWLKIYRWIEEKKDELLRRYEIEDRSMIVLYPRFINLKEYWSLRRLDRTRLDTSKIFLRKFLSAIR